MLLDHCELEDGDNGNPIVVLTALAVIGYGDALSAQVGSR